MRLAQAWIPDTRDPAVAERIRQECKALASDDPEGDEILAEIELGLDWPEYDWGDDT